MGQNGRLARHNQSLELPAQELDDAVTSEGRNDPDGEIRRREDVKKSGRERLAMPRAAVKFTHQKVGIEEEDDEPNLNSSAQKRLGRALRISVFAGRHRLIVHDARTALARNDSSGSVTNRRATAGRIGAITQPA